MAEYLDMLGGEFWNHLILALFHTLWIGALAALALVAALKALPARRAELRYGAALLALAAIALGGVIALAWQEYTPPRQSPAAPSAQAQRSAVVVTRAPLPLAPAAPSAPAAAAPARSNPLAAIPHVQGNGDRTPGSAWTAWLAGGWLLGAALMLARMIRGLTGAGRVRRAGRPLADAALLRIFEETRAALGVARRVTVLVGEQYVSPFVVGAVWPAVLLPASMLSGLPPEQLRAILAHELAHIRRHDLLANLAQMLVEALLFFNPFVWWIGRQIRAEREACCDALAAAATGRRLDYARALVDFAGSRLAAPHLAGAPAFGDARRASGLLERIRRLAQPGYRPALRLPWHSLAIFFAVAILSLACIKKAGDAAVQITAKALSPAQRVETMKEIAKKFGGGSDRDYGEKDKITVSGRIVTEDGKPLTKRGSLLIHSNRPNSSSSTGMGFDPDGKFTRRIEYGVIRISCQAEGYAIAAVGPLETEPGGKIDNIRITLKPGFTGRVQLLDPQNRPVPGFRFQGHYNIVPNSWTSLWNNNDGPLTDDQGIATINDCSTQPLSLEGSAPGWQETDWKDVVMDPARAVPLKIAPAAVTEGVVVGAKDGFPIPGAKIRILYRDRTGGGYVGSSGESSPVVATTDDDGRFKLDFLRDDTKCMLLIDPPGFRREMVRNVRPGMKDFKIEAQPRIIVRGRVLGAQYAQKYDNKPIIGYAQDYHPSEHNTYGGQERQLELLVKDDVGTFEFSDLWKGELRIRAGSQSKELTVSESVKDVVIDLRPASARAKTAGGAAATSATRDVIFKFDLPQGAPQPTGLLNVHQLDPHSGNTYTYKGDWVTLKDGVARLQVPVPTKVGYSNSGQSLTGYWCKDAYNIDVSDGPGPFFVTIPVMPSGAIFGQVFNKDGKPQGELFVSVVEVAKAPGRENDYLNVQGKNSYSSGDLDNKFNISPLPLGGKYAIVAYHKATFVVSKPIKLTEKAPLCQMDMTLPEGVTVAGRVVDEAGKPLPEMAVNLSFQSDYNSGYGTSTKTGPDGAFAFEHVNPDAAGKYNLSAEGAGFVRGTLEAIRVGGKPLELKLKKGLALTGRVLDDETGKPLEGVEVYASPQTRPRESYSPAMSQATADADGKTDAKGEFHFSRLGLYLYAINCRAGQVQPQVQAEAGAGAMVLVRVKLYEWEKKKRAETGK